MTPITDREEFVLRTILAATAFAVLYGLAIRLYLYLRARRDSARWHGRAVLAAAAVGGAAFYVAQQVRQPHAPSWLDLAAFLIMALAAAAVPVIVETTQVVQARLLRQSRLQAPPSPTQAPPDGHS